jgi:hypothetical protein
MTGKIRSGGQLPDGKLRVSSGQFLRTPGGPAEEQAELKAESFAIPKCPQI